MGLYGDNIGSIWEHNEDYGNYMDCMETAWGLFYDYGDIIGTM